MPRYLCNYSHLSRIGLALSASLVGLSLTGCQSVPIEQITTIEATPTYPGWYQSPPADSQAYLYGMGEGKTASAATKDALSYLSAKLSVSVTSKTDLQKTLHTGVYEYQNTNLNKTISTQVKDIEINHFEQVNMKQIAYQKFIVLIKVDKRKLTHSFQQKLSTQVQAFQQDKRIQQQAKGYAQYLAILPHYLALPKFQSNLAIYKSLVGKTVSSHQFDQFIKKLDDNTFAKKQAVHFSVQTQPGSVNHSFKSTLTHYIQQQGFQVNSKQITTDTIKLSTYLNPTQAEGFYILRTRLKVSYTNSQTKTTNQLNLKGQGLNKKQATANLQSKFYQQLEQQGLNKMLGLSLP